MICLWRMSTDRVTPDVQDGPAGVLVGAETQPRWGERAALIRKIAMRYPELSTGDIAKRVGCTPQNVGQVLSSFLSTRAYSDLKEYQSNKADIYDAVQFRALASITEDKLQNSSAMQLVTVAAILEDKSRLVRGQPTSIHVHALVDVLDALRMREDQQ